MQNNNIDSKKTRIKRYCPKLDDIDLDLLCEWNLCEIRCKTMDSYLQHIEVHLNDYFKYVDFKEQKQEKSNEKHLDCKWRECDFDSKKFDCESTYERHIYFHAFHTKLKFIGELVINNINSSINNNLNNNFINQNKIQSCALDQLTRNLIPELPYKFECSWNKCDYKSDNPELFYRHIKDHTKQITYSKLKSKKNEKSNNNNNKCLWSNECEHIIQDNNRLIEHLRHHTQEKLVACYVCGALFSRVSKYLDHCSRSNIATNETSIQFQCSHCNKKFLTNNLLKEHIRKHINKYKCDHCDMTCIDKNDLNKHILYKHTNDKQYKCEYCDYECKTNNDLNKHIQIKHCRNEYECNECDFKVKDLNTIKRHMLKYHLNTNKQTLMYKCHVCDKLYSHGSSLSIHLKSIHKYKWPPGHSRFRYKLDDDGFYRLQTLRYESIELVEQINRQQQQLQQNLQNNRQLFSMQQIEQNKIITYETLIPTSSVTTVPTALFINNEDIHTVEIETNNINNSNNELINDRGYDFEDENGQENNDIEMQTDVDNMNNEIDNISQIDINNFKLLELDNSNYIVNNDYEPFDSTNNMKTYLIQRLINDEHRIINSNNDHN